LNRIDHSSKCFLVKLDVAIIFIQKKTVFEGPQYDACTN
jgi:hypothetical protein